MANIARAFTLALAGDAGALATMLSGGEVTAGVVRQDGMYRGYALMHAAASKGHSSVVDLLIRAGADVRARNASGKTPAQLAADKQPSVLAMGPDLQGHLDHRGGH